MRRNRSRNNGTNKNEPDGFEFFSKTTADAITRARRRISGEPDPEPVANVRPGTRVEVVAACASCKGKGRIFGSAGISMRCPDCQG